MIIYFYNAKKCANVSLWVIRLLDGPVISGEQSYCYSICWTCFECSFRIKDYYLLEQASRRTEGDGGGFEPWSIETTVQIAYNTTKMTSSPVKWYSFNNQRLLQLLACINILIAPQCETTVNTPILQMYTRPASFHFSGVISVQLHIHTFATFTP